MKTKIAIEYCGYEHEELVAVGEAEIATLDLEDRVEHYWSSGYADPIEPIGLGPRYRVDTIELPAWADPKHWWDSWSYRRNCRSILELEDADNPKYAPLVRLAPQQCEACVRLLKVRKFRSPYLKSLREQLERWLDGQRQHSTPFSPRQLDSLVRAYHI